MSVNAHAGRVGSIKLKKLVWFVAELYGFLLLRLMSTPA